MAKFIRKVINFLLGHEGENSGPLTSLPRDIGGDMISRRLTPREKTSQTGVVWVTLSDNTRINVNNISYGGLSLLCQGAKLKPYLNADGFVDIKLHIYHLSFPCQINLVHERSDSLGCAFAHSSPDSLLFLRQVLEFIRIGSNVRLIPADHRDGGKPEDSKRVMYSGELGTEIILEAAADGEVPYFCIKFVDGGTDCKVTYENSEVTFQRFIDHKASGDFLALQQGFFILLGFMECFHQPGLSKVALCFRTQIDALNGDQEFNRFYLTG